MITIYHGDNVEVLRHQITDACADLIYIDPPFNTGSMMKRTTLRTVRDRVGDRQGYQGHRYKTERLGTISYADRFDDYCAFLAPRLHEAYRVLRRKGSLFFHIDWRESHYCKVLLDQIFGRECCMNEIIWAYDYGARSTKRWSTKHDTIFWYVKTPGEYIWNFDAVDRIPYMAPKMVGAEKAARGKPPTDVWWHTIVPTNGREKTGYPTQKPLGILERIVKVHSNPDDLLLDFFAGSGSFGEAALRNGRRVILVDSNPEAIRIMKARLAQYINERKEDTDESELELFATC